MRALVIVGSSIDEDYRNAQIDQHGFGELQQAFERFDRVGGAGPIERRGMIGVARG